MRRPDQVSRLRCPHGLVLRSSLCVCIDVRLSKVSVGAVADCDRHVFGRRQKPGTPASTTVQSHVHAERTF